MSLLTLSQIYVVFLCHLPLSESPLSLFVMLWCILLFYPLEACDKIFIFYWYVALYLKSIFYFLHSTFVLFGSVSYTFLYAAQSFQILEEPGEDNTKFDNIVPTIVKPKTAEEFNVESALKGHVSWSLIIHCLSM